jgi:dephospho-CoA kinase
VGIAVFVGLTGVIGSGKSETLEACGRLGAAVLSTDEVVHEPLSEDEVRHLLVEHFGQQVLSGGRIDRDAVAEVVFERPEELSWLEGVLFPRVGEQIARWRTKLEQAEHNPKVAVVEVPLLFEAGIEGIFDAVLAVVAEGETAASVSKHVAIAARLNDAHGNCRKRRRRAGPTSWYETTAQWRSSRTPCGRS